MRSEWDLIMFGINEIRVSFIVWNDWLGNYRIIISNQFDSFMIFYRIGYLSLIQAHFEIKSLTSLLSMLIKATFSSASIIHLSITVFQLATFFIYAKSKYPLLSGILSYCFALLILYEHLP